MNDTSQLPTLYIEKGLMLESNQLWENRFEIRSETSNRVYTIAQNKKKRHWACDCPGWKAHRKCKHLTAIRVPNHEQPYEPNIIAR